MARPHSDDPRNKRLWIRLTARENLAMLEAVHKSGLSMSEWGRRRMLTVPRWVLKRWKEVPYPPENMSELREVGAKINAIAHALNAGQPISVEELRKHCVTLREIIKPHLAAAGLSPRKDAMESGGTNKDECE